MLIQSIAWQRAGSAGSETGTYNSFKLYLAVASGSELTDTYESNYVPGSRTLVYETPTQTMSAGPDEWVTMTLDTPYWYSGTGNLIVEFEWQGGANMFYTYMWPTGTNRGLLNKSSLGSPTGTLSQNMSELRFEGEDALQPMTFAEIKTLF
jgi:hypothetical protein